MKNMSKTFAVAVFTVALVGVSMQLATTSAEAGPRGSVGDKKVAGMTLGSGR